MESPDNICARTCYASRMKLRVVPVVFMLLVGLSGCKSGPQRSMAAPATSRQENPATGTATTFDFYLLNLSWSPNFALRTRPPQSAPHAQLLCSTACGPRTQMAPIRRIAPTLPAPPTPLNTATSTRTLVCCSMNGKRTEPVPGSVWMPF